MFSKKVRRKIGQLQNAIEKLRITVKNLMNEKHELSEKLEVTKGYVTKLQDKLESFHRGMFVSGGLVEPNPRDKIPAMISSMDFGMETPIEGSSLTLKDIEEAKKKVIAGPFESGFSTTFKADIKPAFKSVDEMRRAMGVAGAGDYSYVDEVAADFKPPPKAESPAMIPWEFHFNTPKGHEKQKPREKTPFEKAMDEWVKE